MVSLVFLELYFGVFMTKEVQKVLENSQLGIDLGCIHELAVISEKHSHWVNAPDQSTSANSACLVTIFHR